MAHTPGPWRVHSEHADRIIVNGCCVYQVRDMTTEDGYAGNGYGQPSPVDVRLMAAAPDLLAVCKLLYQCMGEVIEDQNEVAFSDLRMAIMKAEGET